MYMMPAIEVIKRTKISDLSSWTLIKGTSQLKSWLRVDIGQRLESVFENKEDINYVMEAGVHVQAIHVG
jgi:hypothetical protein